MGIGFWQIIIILLVVLIFFGAGKLPNVMGDLGKGIKSFKAGLNGESEKESGKEEDKPPLLSDKDKES